MVLLGNLHVIYIYRRKQASKNAWIERRSEEGRKDRKEGIEWNRQLHFITVVLFKNLQFLLFTKAVQQGRKEAWTNRWKQVVRKQTSDRGNKDMEAIEERRDKRSFISMRKKMFHHRLP